MRIEGGEGTGSGWLWVVGFGGVSNLHFCCYWWRGITYWSNCAGLRCWYPAQLPFTV